MQRILCFIGLSVLFFSHTLVAQSNSSSQLDPAFSRTPHSHPIILEENSLPQKQEGPSLSQRVIQSGVPAFIAAFTTFPPLALKLDLQSGEGIGKSFSRENISRGLTANVIAVVPQYGIMIATQQLLGSEDDSPLKQVAVGFAAGVASGIAVAPLELVMTQQRHFKKSFLDTTKQLYRRNGLKAFTQGTASLILRDSIGAVGLFGIPAVLQSVINPTGEESWWKESLTIAMGGAITATLTQPFDVIRGKIQRPLLDAGQRPQGMINAAKHIYNEQKTVKALWSGLIPRIGIMVTAFLTVDTTTRIINKLYGNTSTSDLAAQQKAERRGDLWAKIEAHRRQRAQSNPKMTASNHPYKRHAALWKKVNQQQQRQQQRHHH